MKTAAAGAAMAWELDYTPLAKKYAQTRHTERERVRDRVRDRV
jgi:hypothetical protein